MRALKQINREKCEHASRFRRLCAQKNTHVERKTKKKKKNVKFMGVVFPSSQMQLATVEPVDPEKFVSYKKKYSN